MGCRSVCKSLAGSSAKNRSSLLRAQYRNSIPLDYQRRTEATASFAFRTSPNGRINEDVFLASRASARTNAALGLSPCVHALRGPQPLQWYCPPRAHLCADVCRRASLTARSEDILVAAGRTCSECEGDGPVIAHAILRSDSRPCAGGAADPDAGRPRAAHGNIRGWGAGRSARLDRSPRSSRGTSPRCDPRCAARRTDRGR
jgi:hypothetical protein